MKPVLKVSVIGAGSTYTPELVNGFLERTDSFPLSELCLMDIDPHRLEIIGGFTQRMVRAQKDPFIVSMTTDKRAAIRGASYVITQLRVGGMEARRNDEYLGLRHGVIGQETTGIGGMAKALRTIPVILNIARDIRDTAPDALLVNFTNPSGLITEAITRYAPDISAVGVCNVPITSKMTILDWLKQDLGYSSDSVRAQLNTLGLNHLSWHRGFTIDEKDVWSQVMMRFREEVIRNNEAEWDLRTIDTLNMIPNGYLRYFYYPERELAKQKIWPPSRAEEVQAIEKQLLLQYARHDRIQPPEDLMKRGGAYYSTTATQLVNAHFNDLKEVHIVNMPHRGAVPGWSSDWVLEMPCSVRRSGIEPLPAEPLPQVCFGLLAQVKSYELLTVEAAVHGDKHAAYQALLAHPLGPSADKVQALLDDLLQTNRAYLPQFQV
jgi:6-phospho-beta-glucosidase